MSTFRHIMVDLETMATTPDALIWQIGACAFDPETGVVDDECSFSMFPDPNGQQGRRIDADTVAWWMRQPDEARLRFGDPDVHRVDLEFALAELERWARFQLVYRDADPFVWSHGAPFDLPILKHAMAAAGLTPWWRHWHERDTRTLFAAVRHATGQDVVIERGDGIHHDACDDTIAQARAVCRGWAAIQSDQAERDSAA